MPSPVSPKLIKVSVDVDLISNFNFTAIGYSNKETYISFSADGREVEYVRNAGSSTAGLVFERLDDRHEGVRLNYEEGGSCVNSFNKTVTFSTYIDFLCSQVTSYF